MDHKEDHQAEAEQLQPPYRRRYFGRGLRRLRDNYGERMSASDALAPVLRAKISTNALVECMRRAGHSIGVAAFNEIENGLSVPREAQQFLAAVAICLRLAKEDVDDLELRLASDILYARLGERADELIERRLEWDAP